MKLVMTLLVRNEIDIVAQNIEYHLARGVDHVIATDNDSTDGTSDILVDYEKQGVLTLLHETGQDFQQIAWVTKMALMARERFGASWILNNDADEFWRPRQGTLKDVIRSSAGNRTESVQMLVCRRRNMVTSWNALDDATWPETLIYRVRAPVRLGNRGDLVAVKGLPVPYYYLALPPKVLLRAQGLVRVGMGNHSGEYEVPPRRMECDIDVYHYPIRSRSRFELSVRLFGKALTNNPKVPPNAGWQYRRWLQVYNAAGGIEAPLREALPGPRGLVMDRLIRRVVKDTRMRDEIASLSLT